MDKTVIRKMRLYIENSLILERISRPNLEKLPIVKVGKKQFHYEKRTGGKFGPNYIVHGKNGARYGLFQGTESNEFFPLNLKTKKVVSSIGRFVETESGLLYKRDYEAKLNETEELYEEGDKNLHMEHIEDRVIDLGSEGAKQSLMFLRYLKDSLSSSAEKPKNITVKWDGAPAVFSGIDPETGKFFVGTKAVFNKNPKMNFSHQDIDINHEGGLAEKLHAAFEYLKDVGITGVLQGDMMYTREDLEVQVIDGEKVITFQPNTIVYSVPYDSELGQEILNTKMGIVFHTTYVGGPTLQDMSAKFGADVSNLESKNVWIQDATYKDVSGTATLTENEVNQISGLINEATSILQKNAEGFDSISQNEKIMSIVKVFNNAIVREGKFIENPKKHAMNLMKYYKVKQTKAIDKLKTDKAKQPKLQQLDLELEYIKDNFNSFVEMFRFMVVIVEAKYIIIRKLQRGEALTKTLVKTDTGYKVTSPEGFVAIDNDGKAVKLVDRLEFSTQNFNAAKNWSKEPKTESLVEDTGKESIKGKEPVIVVSGRFQGFQKGHDSLIQEAKSKLATVGASKVALVVVEGKKTTGDPKNPLTGPERIKMLQGIYGADKQVVVISKPSPIGFIVGRKIKGVLATVAEDGYYIKGWVAGSDRFDTYTKMLDNFKENENYHNDVIDILGYLPVERDENGEIILEFLPVDRDETGEGSGLGSIENFGNKDNEKAQELFNKIISSKEDILPKEVMSGSIVRNLIKVWNIPFDAWYKEVVPPQYKNVTSKKAYKLLYTKLKEIMLNESTSFKDFWEVL